MDGNAGSGAKDLAAFRRASSTSRLSFLQQHCVARSSAWPAAEAIYRTHPLGITEVNGRGFHEERFAIRRRANAMPFVQYGRACQLEGGDIMHARDFVPLQLDSRDMSFVQVSPTELFHAY